MPDIIIKDTHRGLLYQNGVLVRILEAGRYSTTKPFFPWQPEEEIVLVDMRERDLTIKGQEILTADKVALRVSIVVQFHVVDPRSALHAVENYQDRLYSDVQLAARRSLASMSLEEILTNRNRLSEDILNDVKEAAAGYGVAILRADIKDLTFPGNLQETMNRVLTAQRVSEAQLVEARTRAEVQQIEAKARSEIRRTEAEANAEAERRAAETEVQIQQIKTQADLEAITERANAAALYEQHPALLRLIELETLRDLGQASNARIYVNFGANKQQSESDQKD